MPRPKLPQKKRVLGSGLINYWKGRTQTPEHAAARGKAISKGLKGFKRSKLDKKRKALASVVSQSGKVQLRRMLEILHKGLAVENDMDNVHIIQPKKDIPESPGSIGPTL